MFGDLFAGQPIGPPEAALAVADKRVLQPSGQTMLATRFTQTIGHQYESRLGQAKASLGRATAVRDDLI